MMMNKDDFCKEIGEFLYTEAESFISNPYYPGNRQVQPEVFIREFILSGAFGRYLMEKHTPDYYRI